MNKHHPPSDTPVNLSWDNSPQDLNSEATFDWSNHLEPRLPEDFIRFYTDELVEDVTNNIADMPNDEEHLDTDDESFEDDVFPDRCRLERRGAFRNTECSDQVQNVGYALYMIPQLVPRPIKSSPTPPPSNTSSTDTSPSPTVTR